MSAKPDPFDFSRPQDKPNILPRPRTIARKYAKGEFCDYPAFPVFDAVNKYDLDYNPTAIPFHIGLENMFINHMEVYLHLAKNYSKELKEAFLADPNGYLRSEGLETDVFFSQEMAEIFISLAEPDMLDALTNINDEEAFFKFLFFNEDENSWPHRHPERYPAEIMRSNVYYYYIQGFDNYSKASDRYHKTFSDKTSLKIFMITSFLTERKQK